MTKKRRYQFYQEPTKVINFRVPESIPEGGAEIRDHFLTIFNRMWVGLYTQAPEELIAIAKEHPEIIEIIKKIKGVA